jgi:hypothetical protein
MAKHKLLCKLLGEKVYSERETCFLGSGLKKGLNPRYELKMEKIRVYILET